MQRYAQVFNAVEINSSFYRPHRSTTYRRWAAAVPEQFRFSVKFPRSISHEHALRDCQPLVDSFIAGVQELEQKLGCLLLQLPPRMEWEAAVIVPFLDQLRRVHAGPIACEPRHISWFHAEVDRELASHGVSRVAADPSLCTRARVPAGDRRMQYIRLHGSPRIYYDSYADADLQRLAARLAQSILALEQCWCIFDNTAAGHASANALTLMQAIAFR